MKKKDKNRGHGTVPGRYFRQRQPKVLGLMKKQARQRGMKNEERAGQALEILLSKGEIVKYQKATQKQNKAGKDWLFEFTLTDGTVGKGWFDVKSSKKGVEEHKEKNAVFFESSSAPVIKKIRPSLLIESSDTMEKITEKIRKIIGIFSKLYLDYMPKQRRQ